MWFLIIVSILNLILNIYQLLIQIKTTSLNKVVNNIFDQSINDVIKGGN